VDMGAAYEAIMGAAYAVLMGAAYEAVMGAAYETAIGAEYPVLYTGADAVSAVEVVASGTSCGSASPGPP